MCKRPKNALIYFSKNILTLACLTNTVELLQMEGVDSEGEGDEVPRVRLLVHRLVDELVDAPTEVGKHRHHVGEEIVADVNLKI